MFFILFLNLHNLSKVREVRAFPKIRGKVLRTTPVFVKKEKKKPLRDVITIYPNPQ